MIGLRKKCTQLGIIALVAGVFFSHARVSATDTFTPYFDTLSSKLFAETTPLTTQAIISNYCTMVLASSGFSQNNFIYDAKQSVFVYLLCSNVVKDSVSSSTFFTGADKYFARKTFQDLWFQSFSISANQNTHNMCYPMSDECNLAKNVPNLFDDIMTDYVNMKQANFYGLVWDFKTDEDMEAQINIFSQANFWMNICEKSDHSYASTCRAMKWYLKNARNLLSDVRILSGWWILDMVKPIVEVNAKNLRVVPMVTVAKSTNLTPCTTRDENYNILLCGLYGDTSTSMVSFVNLTYNELFYYRLFMSYYFLMLQKNPGTLIKSSQNNDINAIMKKFSSQYTRSKSALMLTFRMMRDTYMAFPFHIGFLMYQEDLDGFWKLLKKIYTPIDTLSYKLSHVQKPE